MLAQDSVLFGNYTLRILDNAEFGPLFRQYRPLIFQTMLDFDVQQALSIEEQTATARFKVNDQFVLVGDLGVGGDFRGMVKYLLRFK